MALVTVFLPPLASFDSLFFNTFGHVSSRTMTQQQHTTVRERINRHRVIVVVVEIKGVYG